MTAEELAGMDGHEIRAAVEGLANTPMSISSADWNRISSVLLRAADEIERLHRLVQNYESADAERRVLVRRLDVALNGEGAAKQASLVDLVAQFERKP